jgi:hypothetical protein
LTLPTACTSLGFTCPARLLTRPAPPRPARRPSRPRSCRIPWPKPPAPRYPQELHDLVAFCLNTDPAARPTSEHLLQRVSALRRQRLPDAAPQGAPPARADGATPGGAVATGVARR